MFFYIGALFGAWLIFTIEAVIASFILSYLFNWKNRWNLIITSLVMAYFFRCLLSYFMFKSSEPNLTIWDYVVYWPDFVVLPAVYWVVNKFAVPSKMAPISKN